MASRVRPKQYDVTGAWTAEKAEHIDTMFDTLFKAVGKEIFIRPDQVTGIVPITGGGTGADTAAEARENLGVEIGVDVQASDPDLSAVAALSGTGLVTRTGTAAYTTRTLQAGANIAITNPAGIAGDPSIAVTGVAALPIDLTTDVTGALPITNGGTGATSAVNARDNLGVEIGADVQAYDPDLTALAAMAGSGIVVRTAANTYAQRTLVAGTGINLTNPAGIAGDLQIAVQNPFVDHNLLDGDIHLDTNAHPVNKGDIIVGNTTPEWDGLAVGADGDVLTADSGEALGVKWATPTGGSGTDAFVPTFIASGDTFTVPVDKQALFGTTIDNEGILDVIGMLIEVDPETLVDLTADVTGVLPAANGGFGVSPLAQGDVFYASSTTVISALAKSASASRYLSNTGTSNNPAWAQVNLANGVTGVLPLANITQGAALSVLGVTGNATADHADITAGSDHQVLRRSGTAVAFGAVNLAQSAAVTGTLADGNLSSNVPLKNGTNAFTGANSFATNVLDLLVGQIKFPSSQNASANANTLDDYEEGSWSPVDQSGAALGLTTVVGRYVKVGQIVLAAYQVVYPATADATGALLGGLPFASTSNSYGGRLFFTSAGTDWMNPVAGTQFSFYTVGAVPGTNANMSGQQFNGVIIYQATA